MGRNAQPTRTAATRCGQCAVLLASLLLAACTGLPLAPGNSAAATAALYADAQFADTRDAAAIVAAESASLFTLSAAMQQFIDAQVEPQVRRKGPSQALLDALYHQGRLGIVYDASRTRNAAQTFEARAGNCMSLVVMTSAIAKALGLDVTYQSAAVDDAWARSGDLLLISGHVNLTLGRRMGNRIGGLEGQSLTVDFLPPEQLRGLRTQAIDESRVRAMFLNNRAAEALLKSEGQATASGATEAYWWARAAVAADPDFAPAVNTLGVVYLRHGLLTRADAVFEALLARSPDDLRALGNRILVLQRLGRDGEATLLQARLARIEPEPPLHHFDRGRAALDRGELRLARDMFRRELGRGGDSAEVHHWLALALHRLGDEALALKHLALAVEHSRSRGEHELYSAKLSWMRAVRP